MNSPSLSHYAKIGELLQQAGLITEAQLAVAIQDQLFSGMRLGEILATRQWVKQETIDFFVDQWPELQLAPPDWKLGDYLEAAALLDRSQVEALLAEQKRTGMRFGSLAVLNGWIKQSTLDFFIQALAPERQSDQPFMRKDRSQPSPSYSTANTIPLDQPEDTLDEEMNDLDLDLLQNPDKVV